MGRDHRGSSSRASNRSSDTNRNTRIPAPKSSSQPSSTSSRRPNSRMTINMTTTITTSGAHSGLIVQSGVASAPAPSHGQQHSDPWSLPSVSSPLPSLAAAPAAVQQAIAAPTAPRIEEIAPTTSEDEHYAPPSHHSVDMPRLVHDPPYESRQSAHQPRAYESPRYEEVEREEEISFVDPRDVQLNTFSTNPPPAPTERVSRRDQPPRDLPMRPDTTSTTTYMEIFREPGEPLHAYQRLALPPSQKPDLLYGPRYEQWSNTRTETLIDDRGGKAVQWKSDLVETDDERPLSVTSRGRDASSSPSYVRARSRETRQDTKNGRVIKESISDEDVTIETRSGPLSPHLFSPSSAASPRIGNGASPVRLGWGAAPPPQPIVTSPSIGSGARPLSPMSVDTRSVAGYGAVPYATRPASRARTPDDYHDALPRRGQSPSPLRRTTTSYVTSPGGGYTPSSGYSRPPPSYRSGPDSRFGSPTPGELDRSKSSARPDSTAVSDPRISSSFHEEGPAASAAPVVQHAAAAAQQDSPIYAAPKQHVEEKQKTTAPSSPIYGMPQPLPKPPTVPIYGTPQQSQPPADVASPKSPIHRTPQANQKPASDAASTASHSPIYGVLSDYQKPEDATAISSAEPLIGSARESKHSAPASPIYGVLQDFQKPATTTEFPIYGAPRERQIDAVATAPEPLVSSPPGNAAAAFPTHKTDAAAAKSHAVETFVSRASLTLHPAANAADFGLRLSQLSPRRNSMTQTEEELLQQLQLPAAPSPPPRPPPPTFARPMHRTTSYRLSLPPSARLSDERERVYDQIPLERGDSRRHSFTCPPAFISRRSLEKIVQCLNEFPKSRRRSGDFSRSTDQPVRGLQRSQSVGGHEQQRRPAITRIPVERRPSEDEDGEYESVENRRPVRVTIDYDPRYAKVVKPTRPPPPRKPLSSTATFAPSTRSIRERSPSKIVRIINGRSFSVDGGRKGRHRPMAGTSPTPPDPRSSAAPTPPSIASLPASRPTSTTLRDLPSREEERRNPPPLAKERLEEADNRGRERSKPPPRPPPPNLLKSAPSESILLIPARRSRSMSEKPSMRAARMPDLPEDTDILTPPSPQETPGISLAAGAHFDHFFTTREREREQTTVAVDDPHGNQEVPHDSPNAVHSPKKATPRQLKRRSQELDDLISFTDDVARPEFLEMAPPPEPKPEPETRPVPTPRTTTPTGIGSSPSLLVPEPNTSTDSSPTVVVDEHRLRIIGLYDFEL